MIMEYAEGGELFDYIIKKDHLSEEETRNIFHQIIDAIDYMHQMGICHRDLKPENILFDSSHKRIKIIDFGLSNLYYTNNNELNNDNSDEKIFGNIENDLLETPCGSPGYAPPEMVLGYSYNGLLTDLWSSGIILYAMLCGSFPFDDDSEQVLYSKIIKGDFEFPEDITLTEEAKNLVKKILVVNPSHRANINDIKNDPWFKINYKPTYGLYLPIQEIPIDNKIINEMEKNGYKKEDIIKNIKNNRHNEITTFYYLLVKQFSRKGIDTINDLISPCFYNYIMEENEKVKNLSNKKILINLKLIFEKLKLEEAEKIVKELEKQIDNEKEKIKGIKENNDNENNNQNLKNNKNKERKKVKETVKDITINKNESKNNFTVEIINNHKEDTNINNINNFSHKNEENSRNLNNTNIYKNKNNQIKHFRNIILGALHKNKKYKKLKKNINKKDICKKYLKKLKLNSYSLEKSSRSNNKKELKTSINLKKDAIFNLSFPYNDNDISNTLVISSKRDKNNNNQGINSSRTNTDRLINDKNYSMKQNIKAVIKKGNIPLYQKFTLNSLNYIENKKPNIKRKYKANKGFINKVVKNTKTSAFNVYYLNKNYKLKKNNNNTTNSIKNIKSKNNTIIKSISIQKEKGNMSYRLIQKDKNIFENNLSKILTVSEGKSNSNSQGKGKIHINTPFSTSSRNKYNKNNKNKKLFKNGEILENNHCFKKKRNYGIENKEKKMHELKINPNKSNEHNNINFSININLNLNQIKNLKEKERTATGEQNKHQKLIKSLKGIKLDLKKINNNNNQIFNRNSLINSERINYDNIYKIKQDLITNKNNNYIKIAKSLINPTNNNYKQNKNNSHSKEEYKSKKFDDIIFKSKEYKQKSNIYTNSLTKLLPFLKCMNSFKTKSLKKPSPNKNKRIMTLINNNSNSIIINKANTNTNTNINQPNRYKVNKKIEQIKLNKKLINYNFLKNISNKSNNTENFVINSNQINQDRNNRKISPLDIKMKPLNIKGLINENKSSYVYKSLTMRGEQNNNRIIKSINDELSKSGNNKIHINNKKDNSVISSVHLINKISPNKNLINNDAIFEITPFKIKDILLSQLPKYNININQKSSKNNDFVFHCFKGLVKIIIELLKIKGNDLIFVKMKCFSGNQKEFLFIRKKILGIINSFKNINI